MPLGPHVPVRQDEIILAATLARVRYRGCSVDDIAEREQILLYTLPDARVHVGGYGFRDRSTGPLFVPSEATAGTELLVWKVQVTQYVKAIAINPAYVDMDGYRRGVNEIFWHEYFHITYSPRGIDRIGIESLFTYSTTEVLHLQEERRADDFAALVLVDDVLMGDTVDSLVERFAISPNLARRAAALWRRNRELIGRIRHAVEQHFASP